MLTAAYVNIWGVRVGAIAWNPQTGLGSFEFEPNFINNQWNLAPLKMPVDGVKQKILTFPELRDTSTFKGLPGLLADILPDKYGNALINTWLTRHGRPTDSLNPIEMLSFILLPPDLVTVIDNILDTPFCITIVSLDPGLAFGEVIIQL